jgi:putative endonuclease
MAFSVYMMASARNGTLYCGSTDDLARRVWEHRTGARRGFTKRYNVKILVWHEQHEARDSAKRREATIKAWNRQWKLELIETANPGGATYMKPLAPSPNLDPRFRGEYGIGLIP